MIAGIHDVNSAHISSANSATGNGSKLRQRMQTDGRTGRLIRQFERQLEFRVRPRASEYARSIFICFKFSDFDLVQTFSNF